MATFCLIHGNWHDGSCWQPLIECLEARGHKAVAPDLPFDDPATTYADRIRPPLEALADVSGPVVVVGHSMASGYAPLVAVEHPGSLRVEICPRMAFTGGGCADPIPEGLSVSNSMSTRCNGLAARGGGRRHVRASSSRHGTSARRPPTSRRACSWRGDDEIFDPRWERFMARELLRVEPIEIPGGHYPMLEDPEGLADLLDEHGRRSGSSLSAYRLVDT